MQRFALENMAEQYSDLCEEDPPNAGIKVL